MTAFALVIGFTSANPVELSAASTCKAYNWTKGVGQYWADDYNNHSMRSATSANWMYRKQACDGNTRNLYVSVNAGTSDKQYMRVEYNIKTGKRMSATYYSGTQSSKGNAAVRRVYYNSNGTVKQIKEYRNGFKESKEGYTISRDDRRDSNGKRTKLYVYTGKSGEYTRYDYTDGKKKTRTAYYKSGSTSRRKVSYYNSKEKVYKSNYYSKKGSSWKCTSTTKY